jgi:hypothetical protein
MSKLLNRGNVFVVVRNSFGYTEYSRSASCGVFSELEEADDYKGMCEQQWKEKVGHLDDVEFEVQLTTYYGR